MKKFLPFLTTILCISLSYSQEKSSPNDKTNYKKISVSATETEKLSISGSQLLSQKSTPSNRNSVSGIGETPGQLSVSLTGGATYTIPVAVPEGINGVQPELALTYNSQGGNGLAGYGWNVSGISVITRIPSTKYHDNSIDPVDFNGLDRFSLDGQRLMLKSGVYGSGGAEYETENFSNIRITSSGHTTFPGVTRAPLYFRVDYPDGSVAYYGQTDNSRSHTDYAITYWENPQGLRVNYEYTTQNNSLSISSITYGARGTATPTHRIRFIYTNRKRTEQSYIGGVLFIRKNLLREIKVESGGIGYRNYEINHNQTALGYDRVTSVREFSGDYSGAHSAITFGYEDTEETVSYSGITTNIGLNNIEQRNAQVVPFDLTGNGRMDFIVYPKKDDGRNKFWVFKNLQNGNFDYPVQVDFGSFESILPVTWLTHNNKILPGQGIAVVENKGEHTVNFKVYSNGAATPLYYQYEKTWEAPTTRVTNCTNCRNVTEDKRVPVDYLSGDFNGDGLSDIIAVERPLDYEVCLPTQGPLCNRNSRTLERKTTYFINLDRRITSGYSVPGLELEEAVKEDHHLLTADVNGDGKTDILHITPNRIYTYTLGSSNTLQLLSVTENANIKNEMPPLQGDYNGDGKSDILIPEGYDSYDYALYLSDGATFTKEIITCSFRNIKPTINESSGIMYGYNLIPTDIDGDGRTDILVYRSRSTNDNSVATQQISIFHNAPSSATNGNPEFISGGSVSKDGNIKHFPVPVFLSSDKPNHGLDFASISDNLISSFSFGMDHRQDVLIRSVSNNGVTHHIEYKGLTQNEPRGNSTPVYRQGFSQTFPNIDIAIAPGTKMVTGLTREVPGTENLMQIYTYYGAVANAEGLGFMGFSGIARSNWHTNSSERKFNVSLHNPALRGAVTTQYLLPYTYNFTSIPSDYITRTDYLYESSLSAGKVFQLKNTSHVTQNSLDGTATTTHYTYDQYMNPARVVTNYSGHGSKTVEITYEHSNLASQYFRGRPKQKTETMAIGPESFATEEQYAYNGLLLSEKKTAGNGTGFITETYVYDNFGNIVKKSTSGEGMAPRQVSFEYSSNGRFLVKSTDTEGREATFRHDATFGTLLSETNPFGQTTTYEYDVWLRPIRITDYLGNSVRTSYLEDGNNHYTVTSTSDDGSGQISEYDALKRLIRTREKDVLGQWVGKSFEYDNYGRAVRESEPYIGAPTQWNETQYDFYGRVERQMLFNGKTINYTYSGLTTTVNDGTKTVTTTKDAMGNITEMQDPGGTVRYTWFGNSEMKSANYDGIVVSMEQDGWGRKIKLTDPSAGEYTYAYNSFGEVVKETTPNGETTYTYGPTGKILQKNITGENTAMELQYTYRNEDGLPERLLLTNADGNNSTYNYTYNTNKQLRTVEETTPYATFTRNFTYDRFGRTATEQNEALYLQDRKTSSITVKNTYAYGALKTKEDNNTGEVFWNVEGINAHGQVTASTGGENILKKYTYNEYGFIEDITSQKELNMDGTGPIMQLTFDFDVQRGILNGRTNSLFAWEESFTHDNQDRLLGFTDNNGTYEQKYDARGRITDNSAAGSYEYTGNSYQLAGLALNEKGGENFKEFARQGITYNAFKAPVEITEKGKEKISFEYNAFGNRANMFYGSISEEKLERPLRRHYSHDGSMEITHDTQANTTTFVTYIGGDAYTAPVAWRSEQSDSTSPLPSGGAGGGLYLHRDYLGSIIMITDKESNILEKRHFDAWGNIVKLQDGEGNGLSSLNILDRGYTGHEHLQGTGLVHMNGRLYDPVLHRFLAPDNYIQDPFNTQNFNRYGYVLNNPLMFTDPSGEFFWIAVGIGAALGAFSQAIQPGATFGSILGGALVGGLAGAVGAGVGNVVAGGTFFGSQVATTVGFWAGASSGAMGGFAGGFVGGAGMAWVNGANFGDGYGAGIKAGAIGAFTGGLINGISSGIRHGRLARAFERGNESLGFSAGDPVPATDEFLKNAQEVWFPDAPMGNIKAFAVEDLPSYAKEYFENSGAAGITFPHVKGTEKILTGTSEVYFNSKVAFSSAQDLFYTMGHELLHASQISQLTGQTVSFVNNNLRDLMEFHSYNYETVLGRNTFSSFTSSQVRNWMTSQPNWYSSLSYNNFSWTLNSNFKYPF